MIHSCEVSRAVKAQKQRAAASRGGRLAAGALHAKLGAGWRPREATRRYRTARSGWLGW